MDNYYWIESRSKIAEIMIATNKCLRTGECAKGVFKSVNCGNPVWSPMVLRKATKKEVEQYKRKNSNRTFISKHEFNNDLSRTSKE